MLTILATLNMTGILATLSMTEFDRRHSPTVEPLFCRLFVSSTDWNRWPQCDSVGEK